MRELFVDAAFHAGMRRRLGGQAGWADDEPDVLVIVASDTGTGLAAEVERLSGSLGGAFRVRGTQLGATLRRRVDAVGLVRGRSGVQPGWAPP